MQTALLPVFPAGHLEPNLCVLLAILPTLSFLLFDLMTSQGSSGSAWAGTKPSLCVLLVVLVTDNHLLSSLMPFPPQL